MTKKLPTAIHEAKGTDRADRQHPDEPRPDTGEPLMPEHLSDEEKVAWKTAVQILLPLGVLTIADGLALEQLACAIVEVRELHKAVTGSRTNTVMSTQKESVDRLNPLYPMYQQSRKELRTLWGLFGLDPLARTSVHTVTPPKRQPNHGDKPEKPVNPAASYFSTSH